MKCKDCGATITLDNSYGKVKYLICEKCWDKMVNDTNLATAYTNLMKKGLTNNSFSGIIKKKERER
jgi:hypothetical protein